MNIQQELFQQVKNRLPAHLSLVDSVSEVLGISSDSAYRRIRGEKSLDLQEAMLLCGRFGISLDGLFGDSGNSIPFKSSLPLSGELDFGAYLDGVERSLQFFHGFPEKVLYYDCKDVPIFHFFHSRQLAAFKYFIWYKYLMREQQMRSQRFSMDDFPDTLYEKGRRIYHLYSTLPSVEIWSVESIDSTLRQLDYLLDTGGYTDKADLQIVYHRLTEMVNSLEESSAAGEKQLILEPGEGERPGSYEVYRNEVQLGANTILAVLGSTRMVFLNHSVFHYAYTTDAAFGQCIQQHMEKLTRTSTQLSQVSEVERRSFYIAMRKMITDRMERHKLS